MYDEIRKSKIIWLFHYLDQLPLPAFASFFFPLFAYLWSDACPISNAPQMQVITPLPQASKASTNCQYEFKGHKIHRNTLGAGGKYFLHQSWLMCETPSVGMPGSLFNQSQQSLVSQWMNLQKNKSWTAEVFPWAVPPVNIAQKLPICPQRQLAVLQTRGSCGKMQVIHRG